MNSKDKGNIGEAIALSEFIKRGVQVSIPFGDNARYDLIADFNNKLNRIQVKYCNQAISENNSIYCPCASSTNHTTNKHYTTYKNDIDYFVFYLVAWNKTLIVPIEIIEDKKTIAFRLEKPKNNQPNYNLVDDYTFETFFKDKDKNKENIENINNEIKIDKIKEPPKNFCIDCGKLISIKATRCNKCASKLKSITQRTVERPNREELKKLIRTLPFTTIASNFKVTDNAIRKWCDAENLPRTKKEINNISDEDWKNI